MEDGPPDGGKKRGAAYGGKSYKIFSKSGTLRVEIIQKLSWKINRKFIGTQRHGDTEN